MSVQIEAYEVRSGIGQGYNIVGVYDDIYSAAQTAFKEQEWRENQKTGIFRRRPMDQGYVSIIRLSDYKTISHWRLIAPFKWLYTGKESA